MTTNTVQSATTIANQQIATSDPHKSQTTQAFTTLGNAKDKQERNFALRDERTTKDPSKNYNKK